MNLKIKREKLLLIGFQPRTKTAVNHTQGCNGQIAMNLFKDEFFALANNLVCSSLKADMT